MSEEKMRWIRELLESGIEVDFKAPSYMNTVVGEGYLGYVIALIDDNNKQFNVVLRVRNNRTLFEQTSITMIVDSVFCYTDSGKERRIEASVINRKVILSPVSTKHKIINSYYFITGTLTLKKEAP